MGFPIFFNTNSLLTTCEEELYNIVSYLEVIMDKKNYLQCDIEAGRDGIKIYSNKYYENKQNEAFIKAVNVGYENLTDEEKVDAIQESKKVLKLYNSAKSKEKRFRSLALIAAFVSLGLGIGSIVSMVSSGNDASSIRTLAMNEEVIKQEIEEQKIELKYELEQGDINIKEYEKRIKEIEDGFDYKYLRDAVLNKATNEQIKKEISDLDKSRTNKNIMGVSLAVATLGGYITAKQLDAAEKRNRNKTILLRDKKNNANIILETSKSL